MKQSKFSFELTPTHPNVALGFECWINDQCVFATDHVQESCTVSGTLPDDHVDAEHSLKLVLKNKQTEHTQISDSGEILHDSYLSVAQLKFDDIELGFDILQTAVYQHTVNGTSELTDHKFFGNMGCNGTVELKFRTPIYIWLLENM